MSVRGRLALAPLALTTALTGCTTSSFIAPQSPTDAVRSFLEAAAAHDGPAACELLTGPAQQEMGAYPKRPAGSAASGRSCQQTVSRLGRLPGAGAWQAMAHGAICVYGSAGRDTQPVLVIYRRRGARATAVGSVQPNLGPGYRIMVPPTPARAQAVAPAPQGAARCSPAIG